jgi:hypothetical protein
MGDPTFAYRKTPAGTEELAAKRLGLARDVRNLLIVVDGRHPVGVFAKAIDCSAEQVAGLVDELLRLGLIEPAQASAAARAVRPEAASAPIAAAARPADAETLRQRLAELARDTFGSQAKPVLDKINKASSSHDGLVAAVEGSVKLAKLTIDDKRAGAFRAEAAKILAL